jgi:hypothetical protein
MSDVKKFVAYVVLATALGAICSEAQERFKKLSGAEIRAKFTGMEFTDEVHWGEVYETNGRLKSEEMGTKRVGTWRIEKDQLCTAYGKEDGHGCYEVWMSGKSVQLRAPDSNALPLEGYLEVPRR